MMNASFVSNFVEYGVAQLKSSTDEDYTSIDINHEGEGLSNFASFGVFNGHGGGLASWAAASYLHKQTMLRFTKLLKASSCISSDEASVYLAADVISEQDKIDAIFCESMRHSCTELDMSITSSDSKAGTTAVSLVLYHNPEDDSIRGYCSNIGDCRCVLYTADLASVLSFRDQVLISLDDSSHTNTSDQELQAAFDKFDPEAPLRMIMMSEDHTPSLLRERSRTLGKNSQKQWLNGPVSDWVSLPANAVTIPNSEKTAILSAFEVGYPSAERLGAADDAIELLRSICGVTGTIEPQKLALDGFKHRLARSLGSGSTDAADLSKDEGSFDETIDLRDESSHGNAWQRLTRSLGDREAPSTCIPLPEISAVSIEKNECGRFVLASHSVWCAMTNAEVRDACMTHSQPQDLASFIANKALRRISAAGKAKHDISVVVVDVNHELFLNALTPAERVKCTIV